MVIQIVAKCDNFLIACAAKWEEFPTITKQLNAKQLTKRLITAVRVKVSNGYKRNNSNLYVVRSSLDDITVDSGDEATEKKFWAVLRTTQTSPGHSFRTEWSTGSRCSLLSGRIRLDSRHWFGKNVSFDTQSHLQCNSNWTLSIARKEGKAPEKPVKTFRVTVIPRVKMNISFQTNRMDVLKLMPTLYSLQLNASYNVTCTVSGYGVRFANVSVYWEDAACISETSAKCWKRLINYTLPLEDDPNQAYHDLDATLGSDLPDGRTFRKITTAIRITAVEGGIYGCYYDHGK